MEVVIRVDRTKVYDIKRRLFLALFRNTEGWKCGGWGVNEERSALDTVIC